MCSHRWSSPETVVEVCAHSWGEDVPPAASGADLVIACDCIYQPACFGALVRTLDALGPEHVCLAWMARGRREEEFLELLEKRWTPTHSSGGDSAAAANIRCLARRAGKADDGVEHRDC